jgi:hypothetical protein
MAARSPRAAQQEHGVPVNWSMMGFGGGLRAEFVPELRGLAGLATLQRMWDFDETCGAMAWAIEATLSQVNWSHTPQKDGKESDDPEAVRMADFADQCLGDMSHGFHEHVEEAATMIPLGFAPCEIVLKQRMEDNSAFPDEFYGFDSLPLRDQHSVTDWKYDESGRRLTHMVQDVGLGLAPSFGAARGASGVIPIWKLLHYRTRSILNNPYGRSILLNAYRPWYLKRKIQDSEAIGIDRELAGMPTFYIPKSDIDAASKVDNTGKATKEALAAQARIQSSIQAVRDLRFNEAGGLVIPSDVFKGKDGAPGTIRQYEFKLVTGGGQRAIDARTAIKDYDRSIARILMFQFLHLGDRSGGSYALSENQSDLALRSLRAITLKISREYQLKALPLLWQVNGFDKRYMPLLEPSPIAEDGLEQLGSFIEKVANAEPLLTSRPELLEALLNRAGLRQARRRRAAGDMDAVDDFEAARAAIPMLVQMLEAESKRRLGAPTGAEDDATGAGGTPSSES